MEVPMVHSGPHLASMILGYGTYQHADSSAETDVFATCSHGHPSSHRKDTAEHMQRQSFTPACPQSAPAVGDPVGASSASVHEMWLAHSINVPKTTLECARLPVLGTAYVGSIYCLHSECAPGVADRDLAHTMTSEACSRRTCKW
jgi:hypothetical protein